MTQLLWLRRDLRLADHPALAAALDGGEPVVRCFAWTAGCWAVGTDRGPGR